MASAHSATPDLVSHCLELLAPLGAVRARRMFGGWGLYLDDAFIALVASEQLFLKVNTQTQAAFERAGCQPFVYASKGKAVNLNYWTAPPDALESPAEMAPWARLALQAALQAALALRAKAVRPVAKRPASAVAKARPRKTPRAA